MFVKGKRNNSIQLVAGGKHLQTDTWSTAGIIVGLMLILYTKLPWLDGVVALFFAALILYTGYHILRGPSPVSWMRRTDSCCRT